MTKNDVIDLIKDAGYCTLATVEGTQPKVRPMMPYLTEEGDLLVATFKGKRILGQISANPEVEACYIDRKMNFCRISGTASVCDSAELKETIFNNAPMLRQYFSSPQDENLVLLVIDTKTVEAMTPQDQVPTVLSLK